MSADIIKKIIFDFFFYFPENYSRRGRKSTNKKSGLIHSTLFILMDYPIHNDALHVCMEQPMGLMVNISIKWLISAPEYFLS